MGKTMIESLVEKADQAPGSPGYHVKAVFPDGSSINAPVLRVGPNWAAFSELDSEEVLIDLTSAILSVDWNPGAAEAVGQRFDHLSAPVLDASPTPGI